MVKLEFLKKNLSGVKNFEEISNKIEDVILEKNSLKRNEYQFDLFQDKTKFIGLNFGYVNAVFCPVITKKKVNNPIILLKTDECIEYCTDANNSKRLNSKLCFIVSSNKHKEFDFLFENIIDSICYDRNNFLN